MPAFSTTRNRLMKLAPEGFTASDGFWQQLLSAYAEPHRHYHNLEHLEEVAAHFSEQLQASRWRRPLDIYYALLCHDVIYTIGAKDNESRSADRAQDWHAAELSHLDLDAARVRQLIEWTAAHGRLGPDSVDDEAALFLDCDMAILGASPERFARYEQQIAEEQCQVHAHWAYALGRRAFVRTLLKAPQIFLSEHFHARLESRARSNLNGL